MFRVGDLVQYGNSGVCQVQEIVSEGISSVKDKLFYLLIPLGSKGSKIYTPVDNEKVVMRKIMTPDEIDSLVSRIADIPELGIPDERSREQQYKQAIHSGSCEEWIKIIKTLYLRKKKRAAQGKKITSTDERYMKSAEDRLYGEFSAALGKDREDVKSYISQRIEKETV